MTAPCNNPGFSCAAGLLVAAAMLAACPAAALNPGAGLQDLNHIIWTARDGAPPGIQALAQTPDGWLWLATPTGLYRFDGRQFERFRPRNGELPRQRGFGIAAQPDGDLMVSFVGGGVAAIRKNGDLEMLAGLDTLHGVAGTFARDADGSLWTAGQAGVFHHARGAWRHAGAADGLPPGIALNVLHDQYGRLWIGMQGALYMRARGAAHFERQTGDGASGRLTMSPDGRLWSLENGTPPAWRALPAPPGMAPLPRAPWFNQTESRVAGQFDRDGNLWTLRCPVGVCMTPGAGSTPGALLEAAGMAVDRLDQPWQMSSLLTTAVLEDREGNVWISTQAGLERFRDNRIVRVRVPGANDSFSMAHGAGAGDVWMVDEFTGTAWLFSPGAAPVADRGQHYSRAANGRDGALLLAGKREIERRHKGEVTRIALPPGADGKPVDLHVLGMVDDGAVLWVATAQLGMIGLADGKWRPRSQFKLPDRIYVGTPGGKGQLWLACADGTVQFYDQGKLTVYAAPSVGFFSGIFAGDDIIASGDKGLAVLVNGRFRKLTAADSEALVNVTGVAVTADGDRWLNGTRGIVHVRAADWRAALDNPALPLRYEGIDALDGYPGLAAVSTRLPSILQAAGGKLWIMTTEGPVTLDTARRPRNEVAPVPAILRLDAGGASHRATSGLRLPPATQSLNIQFTAPSLGKPERLRLQYRLQGVDSGWQEAGARRAAFYTNMEPGAYRFRLRAFNEDGVASLAEAGLAFDIAPTFTQTPWFKALCALAGAGALYLLYRYRLRRATGLVAAQLQVRMAERERIARTLHDTFLQSVQAILLRLQGLSMEFPAGSGARDKLQAILDQADRAIGDGRDQVHDLRSGHLADARQLADAIAQAVRLRCEAEPGVAFSIALEGANAALQPQVAEEACAVAVEAVNNAFSHAGGSAIAVILRCRADALLLTVQDNGKGMTPGGPATGAAAGHWGLLGMRERACRIGARLDIEPVAGGAGSCIRLTVPAALAYTRCG